MMGGNGGPNPYAGNGPMGAGMPQQPVLNQQHVFNPSDNAGFKKALELKNEANNLFRQK